jgi:hypothetical protein
MFKIFEDLRHLASNLHVRSYVTSAQAAQILEEHQHSQINNRANLNQTHYVDGPGDVHDAARGFRNACSGGGDPAQL